MTHPTHQLARAGTRSCGEMVTRVPQIMKMQVVRCARAGGLLGALPDGREVPPQRSRAVQPDKHPPVRSRIGVGRQMVRQLGTSQAGSATVRTPAAVFGAFTTTAVPTSTADRSIWTTA